MDAGVPAMEPIVLCLSQVPTAGVPTSVRALAPPNRTAEEAGRRVPVGSPDRGLLEVVGETAVGLALSLSLFDSDSFRRLRRGND